MGPYSAMATTNHSYQAVRRKARPPIRYDRPLSSAPRHHRRPIPPPPMLLPPDMVGSSSSSHDCIVNDRKPRFVLEAPHSRTTKSVTSQQQGMNHNHSQTSANNASASASASGIRRTSQMTHHPSDHGALRRQQRNIGIRDLQAAMKYGKRTKLGVRVRRCHRGKKDNRRNNNNPRSKYDYNGITYIVDDITKEEITSYSHPVNLHYKFITKEQRQRHDEIQKEILSKEGRQKWKSHTVFLVDKSGSMRQSDVNGSKTRLQAVNLAIAQDFITQRLESGQAKDVHDVVTLVLVGDQPLVVLNCVPTDWILYNTFVDLFYGKYPSNVDMSHMASVVNHQGRNTTGTKSKKRSRSVFEPGGHGNFIPAIQLVHDLFTKQSNDLSSCTLTLALLSDGRPSDLNGSQRRTKIEILKLTSDMASQLGARFNLNTIGIGSGTTTTGGIPTGTTTTDHPFTLLQDMVTLCHDYGSKGEFQLPSLTTSGLGVAFSSLASSVTLSQMELASTLSQSKKRIRPAHRERASLVPLLTEVVNDEEFTIVMNADVIRMEYNNAKKTFQEVSLTHPDAHGVALRTKAFGEGGERLAYQFFEVGADGRSVVGNPMVAKLSRFIEDEDYQVSTPSSSNNGTSTSSGSSTNRSTKNVDMASNEEEIHQKIDPNRSNKRDKFMQVFCERQQKAKSLAQQFNDKLNTIPRLDPGTPRVTFLDCSVYYLTTTVATTSSDDDTTSKTTGTTHELAFLVEPKLSGKFQKWNSNNGYVGKSGNTPKKDHNLSSLMSIPEGGNSSTSCRNMGYTMETAIDVDNSIMLDGITEGANEDNGDDEDEDFIYVTPSEVAQAFSHFSYVQSGGKLLLVDLQGEYNRQDKKFYFTDPVIHYYNKHDPERRRQKTLYGRTDMGRKGMTTFFDTHCCNALCSFMVRGFKSASASALAAIRPFSSTPAMLTHHDPDMRNNDENNPYYGSKRQKMHR